MLDLDYDIIYDPDFNDYEYLQELYLDYPELDEVED